MGDMVALCCPQYSERPQLAKILSIKDSKLTVQWYDGSWTGQWKVYTYTIGRKEVDWVEEVPFEYVVSDSVDFTPKGNLTAKCRRELKKAYE